MTHSIGLLPAVCAVLLVGVLALASSEWLGIPDLLMSLAGGIAIGPIGLALVNPAAHLPWMRDFFILGVCFVLYEGGREIRLPVLRQVGLSVLALSTLGVLVTAVLLAVVAERFWSLGWPLSLILGAAIASTDPATLIPLVRRLTLPEKVGQTIIAESACNDVMSALLVFAGLTLIGSRAPTLLGGVELFALEVGVGLLVGLLSGGLFRLLVAHERFGFLAQYAVLMGLISALAAFLAADEFSGSGFLAVFVAGIVAGYGTPAESTQLSREDHAFEMQEFGSVTTTLVRLTLFTLLGAFVSSSIAILWNHLGTILLFGCLLMFVIRPIVVWLSTVWDVRAHWRARELWFLCWVRETGVVAAALAGLWLASDLPHARFLSSVVFGVICLTLALQVPTTGYWALRLGLLTPATGSTDSPRSPDSSGG
ncbi:MAG: cation:proton antiporter [Gammaproteobacteria bacterium]